MIRSLQCIFAMMRMDALGCSDSDDRDDRLLLG